MRLKPGMFLCALAIAGLSGCGGTQSQPTAVHTEAPTATVEVSTPTAVVNTPTPVAMNTPDGEQGGLMVTQAEYEAALAKWQAQDHLL